MPQHPKPRSCAARTYAVRQRQKQRPISATLLTKMQCEHRDAHFERQSLQEKKATELKRTSDGACQYIFISGLRCWIPYAYPFRPTFLFHQDRHESSSRRPRESTNRAPRCRRPRFECRVMDLFAHPASRVKWPIAIAHRRVYLRITREHVACRGHNQLGPLRVTGLWRTLPRHLHVVAHLHRRYWRLVGLAAVVTQEVHPKRKLLCHCTCHEAADNQNSQSGFSYRGLRVCPKEVAHILSLL